MTRETIVAEARRWIGTPYVHQASARGAGCDCLGLLRGVWRAIYGVEPQDIPPYTRDWDEVAGKEVLAEAARLHLQELQVGDIAPGDVLLFRMRAASPAKHLGIVSDAEGGRFIHAYSGHGVVESSLSAPWRKRVSSVFAFPGLI